MLLFIAAIVLAGYFYKQLHALKNDPAKVTQEEVKALVEEVGKLIVLPTNEEPTIATVSDLSKLQAQPFFAKAELGDKVLIYQQAKQAFLYRPSTNQIIEVAPLLSGTTTSDTPVNSQPAAATPAQ